jgi:hypothetical protein
MLLDVPGRKLTAPTFEVVEISFVPAELVDEES